MQQPNPLGPIVSTNWLSTHLHNPEIVIFDATVSRQVLSDGKIVRRPGLDEFIHHGHIPHARFLDLLHDYSDVHGQFPFSKPSTEIMRLATEQSGISNDVTVIIYDTANGIWAARAWWLLTSFGHQHVAVLDGGLKKWQANQHPVEFGAPMPWKKSDTSFMPIASNAHFVDKNDVTNLIASGPPGVLINALSKHVFSGQEKVYARAGHIPTSINIPYNELIDPATNTLLDKQLLQSYFSTLPDTGAKLITYCGGGITAAGLALAMAVCDIHHVAIYDGSLHEWSADPEAPLISTY